eukprot:TCALIF_10611-PA protein Name:"Similar to Chymotrypsin BI (Litopenaeus vannamei)" AED:0.23 eAED:0.23 QI:0/0/0/0.6/1/1/5/0/268
MLANYITVGNKVYRERSLVVSPVSHHRIPNRVDQNFGKIVGGQEATPHSHPFIVNLILDLFYFCGGSLIAPNVVLTAAHCTDGVNSVKVTAGAHKLSANEPSQQVQTSTNIITNADFSLDLVDNDVALIILDEPFEINEFVSTIALSEAEPAVGEMVQATGWGKTRDGILATTSDILMDVTIPVGDDADAESVYGPDLDYTTKICIDTTGGLGTCQGDSGGPLFVNDGADAAIVGITSFGSSIGCESGLPSCFTSVPSYNEWIQDNMP